MASKRAEVIAEIARLKQARAKTTSRHLKTDYGKAIRRKQKELDLYDIYQKEARYADRKAKESQSSGHR